MNTGPGPNHGLDFRLDLITVYCHIFYQSLIEHEMTLFSTK